MLFNQPKHLKEEILSNRNYPLKKKTVRLKKCILYSFSWRYLSWPFYHQRTIWAEWYTTAVANVHSWHTQNNYYQARFWIQCNSVLGLQQILLGLPIVNSSHWGTKESIRSPEFLLSSWLLCCAILSHYALWSYFLKRFGHAFGHKCFLTTSICAMRWRVRAAWCVLHVSAVPNWK